MPTTQRIRDPLHNMTVFAGDHGEHLWRLIQTRPFQRLRRIKQLAFSEMVFPGATHTRFAHSLGVLHTAEDLIGVVKQQQKDIARDERKERTTLYAALLHHVGHGPFSHAFESAMKNCVEGWEDHEVLSQRIINETEISEILCDVDTRFPQQVADMLHDDGEKTIHNAIVSSQFDADRLDYMRRDRLMTGSQHAAIDFEWLIGNLEVGEYTPTVDGEELPAQRTFVLGPKAAQAADGYVLGLFQLHQTIYNHKATRGVEKLFSALLSRIFKLNRDSRLDAVGLGENHPLIRFFNDPSDLDAFMDLDDMVILGSLALLTAASDPTISQFAERIRDRKLYQCLDIYGRVYAGLSANRAEEGIDAEAYRKTMAIHLELAEHSEPSDERVPRILCDDARRLPYNSSKEPILIRQRSGELRDITETSDVVRNLRVFQVGRAYFDRDDMEAEAIISAAIEREMEK